MMKAGQSIYIFSLIFHAVISDWVELPKLISTTIKDGDPNVAHKIPLVTLSTPSIAVFTDSYSTITASPSTVASYNEEIPAVTMSSHFVMKNKKTNRNENVSEKLQIPISAKNDCDKLDSLSEAVKVVSENTNESTIIEEALEDAKNDFMNSPATSVTEKLKHLKSLQDKLSIHIRRLSQGVWTDRQARGKKLMGFASMEGALMTIAFLTFAVFLIKIVHQFIRGLQETDMTMVLTMPSTAAPIRFSRNARSDRQLAAAQLLQYMDQFSIKHRLNCDSP